MLKKLLLLPCSLLFSFVVMAETIIVKNSDELKSANKKAQPGDFIILQNGTWENIEIKLTCKGTSAAPIYVKAETPGKVVITGHSQLKIGGEYIIVDGLLFTNGYAGNQPVISFRSGKDNVANNCRVTNSAIDGFNNPKRMDDNNWVLFYGKNNQLDHCSFVNKTNMGVLLAVILDDDRSRENNHSINNNYFGLRIPLGSNGGEIIRVGVSQHCQFASNTHINNNFFEYCDGETEIVSIKSGENELKGNVFKECQGSLVLRHGDNNIVSGNYFLGNDKYATGGVRVINKGQVVVNNIFYKCRGVDFRSPLAVMNGIPNSPAHRYVQVTEAEITGNTFYECSAITFCEGSDAERTLPPDGVRFTGNTLYNTRDSIVYKAYDDIKGFAFANNKVSKSVRQVLPKGFTKQVIPAAKFATKASAQPNVNNIPVVEKQTRAASGAKWFVPTKKTVAVKTTPVQCATAEEIYKQLEKPGTATIQLTGTNYILTKPFVINKPVYFIGDPKQPVQFRSYDMLAVFVIAGNGNLSIERMDIDGSVVNARHFIANDNEGSSDHYSLVVKNSRFANFGKEGSCKDIFYAHKSMIADSIVFRNTVFHKNEIDAILMTEEKDNKGYYSAEHIVIANNSFVENKGILLDIYRGGNDESTLGPSLKLTSNNFTDCSNAAPLISFTGVQVTNLTGNQFTNCNPGAVLVSYKDIVRARHLFEKNKLVRSGSVDGNQFFTSRKNSIQ